MYKRADNIEVESLDWEHRAAIAPGDRDEEIEKVILSPSKENKRPDYKETYVTEKAGSRRKFIDILNENMRLFFIFTLFILPYLIGFLVSYSLFYLYADMSIVEFFSLQEGYLRIEWWAIGMHLLVSISVIGVILKAMFGSFRR